LLVYVAANPELRYIETLVTAARRTYLLAIATTAAMLGQQPAAPDQVKTEVTVVGNISAETPANLTVVNSTLLNSIAGTDLDDRLRAIPGFTLYKRASAVVANPTTQGVSLRGLGSSGASRTLMLWDGVPVNDPFGGWVYWTQFIPDEIESVEIAPGGSTSAFGDRAMSGTIGLITRQPEPLHLLLDYETGNENTQDVTAGFTDVWGPWALSAGVRGFTTDGYYIVPERLRGAVDRRANVRFTASDLRLDRSTSIGNFWIRVNLLAEERGNGTELTHNSTSLGTAALHYAREFGGDTISLVAYDTQEGFHSSFSSVVNNRNTENLTYLQAVPSDSPGGSGFWQRHHAKWNLLAGGDADRVHGVDTDRLRPSGVPIGGGTIVEGGIFAQGDAELGPVRLFGGLRENFTGRAGEFLSPTAGAAWALKRTRLRASIYRGFRAPTLNELYRNFSVGNTFTEANPNLRPETAWGGEAGADWNFENSSIRVTAYRNSLANLITNVTLSSSASSIVRQRQNAAAAISQGVESSFTRRWRAWSGELRYMFADARYSTGYRISQVPRHQGAAHLAWHAKSTLISAGVSAWDYQFDDDLNQFRLPGYSTVELLASQRILAGLSAEASVENLLGKVFYTAETPTPNIGEPRLWRIGLRWQLRP
jgi:outer membrane cobalamin receptor